MAKKKRTTMKKIERKSIRSVLYNELELPDEQCLNVSVLKKIIVLMEKGGWQNLILDGGHNNVDMILEQFESDEDYKDRCKKARENFRKDQKSKAQKLKQQFELTGVCFHCLNETKDCDCDVATN